MSVKCECGAEIIVEEAYVIITKFDGKTFRVFYTYPDEEGYVTCICGKRIKVKTVRT